MADAACTEIQTTSSRLIGHVEVTLTNSLNPEVVVLSGSIVQTKGIIMVVGRAAVYGASHPRVTRDLRTDPVRWGLLPGWSGRRGLEPNCCLRPAS